ncbi:MAG: regulatory protein [Actinomycetota bacterium]|nr:regulatory protein [Actinomycetota bacterium]
MTRQPDQMTRHDGRTGRGRAPDPPDDAEGPRRLDPAAVPPTHIAAGPTPGSAADEAPEPDPDSVARTILLRKLTAAPRTRAQLADDLRRREVPDDVAERALDGFVEVGLIDDAAFARSWVTSRASSRGLSRSALRQELRRRGVADETVAAAVEQIADEDEMSAARALVHRRMRTSSAGAGLPADVRMRRLSGLLARKGYSSGVALQVVREALAEESRP